MENWLKELLVEVDSVNEKDFIELKGEVQDGETVAGVAGDWLKRLFTLLKKTIEQGLPAEKELEKVEEGSEKYNQLRAKIYQLKNKVDILENIFWYSINHQFNLWDKRSVGIRKGYKVVWYEKKKDKRIIEATVTMAGSSRDASELVGNLLKVLFE